MSSFTSARCFCSDLDMMIMMMMMMMMMMRMTTRNMKHKTAGQLIPEIDDKILASAPFCVRMLSRRVNAKACPKHLSVSFRLFYAGLRWRTHAAACAPAQASFQLLASIVPPKKLSISGTGPCVQSRKNHDTLEGKIWASRASCLLPLCTLKAIGS